MDVINDALEAAVTAKDKSEWTPVSVNVAPATLTILSKQVSEEKPGCTGMETHLEVLQDFWLLGGILKIHQLSINCQIKI